MSDTKFQIDKYGRWTVNALKVNLGLSATFAASHLGYYAIFSHHDTVMPSDLPIYQIFLGTMTGVGLAVSLTSWVVAVLFLVWMRVAYINAKSMVPAGGLSATTFWIVASWIIPFINMYQPYMYMTEIWRASDPRTELNDPAWINNRVPMHLPLWWALYIGQSVFSLIFVFSRTSGDNNIRFIYTMLTTATSMGATWLLLTIVRTITEHQHQRLHMRETLK